MKPHPIEGGHSLLKPTSGAETVEQEPLESTLFRLTNSCKLQQIRNHLEHHPDLDITQIKTYNQHTLLHAACLNNQLSICRIFFAHITKQSLKFDVLRAWVNARTTLGHTALYFASLKGNISLISYLEEHGANIFIKDNEGLTMIHAAAQGDQPVSVSYFNSKGLSLHEKDEQGRTPLHLAAREGMTNTTNYLTTKDCLLDLQDDEFGYTPLHYAVLSGNAQVAKRLLVKGASTSVKDFRGQTPFDLAVRNSSFTVANLFQKKNWVLKCLGIKQSYSANKHHYTFVLCIFLFTTIPALHILFVFPFIGNNLWIIWAGIRFSLSFVTFLLTWLVGPGFIKNRGETDILSLLRRYDPHQICPDCTIVRLPRSKHCEVCEACVSVYDHHCTWVSNCIGAKNYKYFVAFIFTVLLTLIDIIVMDIVFYRVNEAVSNFTESLLDLSSESLLVIKDVVCLCCLILALSLLIPLLILNCVQLKNLLEGKTTLERLGTHKSKARRGGRQSWGDLSEELIEQGQSQPQRLCCTNILDMCFRNAQNPEYINNNLHSFPLLRPKETKETFATL